MYEQIPDHPELLSQHKALLDQLEAWHNQTKLSPAQESRYDVLYASLEVDAEKLVGTIKDNPKAAANINLEPIQPELDDAANLRTIWQRIDFAGEQTQQRYLNLLQSLHAGGIGALALEHGVETERPAVITAYVKLLDEGIELEGGIYPYHPRAHADKDNSNERRQAFEMYVTEPELELKFREIWKRVSLNPNPTKSVAVGLLAWLDQFESRQRKLFEVSKPYGFTSQVKLGEGVSLQFKQEELSTEFPNPVKYRLTAGQFYDAMHYFYSNQDLRQRMEHFGLRQVTEKMMNDIDVYRELPKRPPLGQPVTPEQFRKMAAARRQQKRAAVEQLFILMEDMPLYSSFLEELDQGEHSPAHRLTGEFLATFLDRGVPHYKLREAWDKHLHHQRQQFLSRLTPRGL